MIKMLKDVKNGEFFTLKDIECPSDNQVYIKGYYCRDIKKYHCCKFTDCLGNGRYISGTTNVFVGFTF